MFYIVVRQPRIYQGAGGISFYADSKCYIRWTREHRSANANDPILETCEPYNAIQNEQKLPAIIRTISNAEETYRATVGNGKYAGNLNTLYTAGLIPKPAENSYFRYYFFAGEVTSGTSTSPPTFCYRIKPTIYRVSGVQSFYIDQTGILRGADHQGIFGSADDPPIEN